MWRLQQVFDKWHRLESARFFLWLPVCLGAGMAVYYALHVEPGNWLYLSPVFLLILCFLRQGLPRGLALILLALSLAATGAAYAKYRAADKSLRMLEEPLPIRPVTGVVDALEYVDGGVRITLSQVRIERLDKAGTPTRIRVSYRARNMPELRLGQSVSLRAALLPPSGPVMPNAFDFSRYFYFRDIGAVGYAIPPIRITGEVTRPGFRAWLDESRDAMTASIRRTLPGVNGAVAAGLITGDDAAIPQQVNDELRAANLLHIIAISGSHMVVIGGLVFVVLRSLLVLIPGFGLRPAVKTLTAFLTLIAITAYVAITGFELSAVRAYVMLALMLVSILVRRDAEPMRSIALAALLMLLYDPSDVIEPGFQLSFAATLALIAAFDVFFQDTLLEGASRLHKAFRLFCFLLLTTIVAQLATTPIILFHFNNLTLYGVVSNLVLTPVVTFILMPMVALYFLLLPFGLGGLALHIMAYGIEAMLYVAHEVSGWPFAITYLPSPAEWGIALATLGLVWLCLWQSRARRFGALAVIIGTATLFLARTPDLFISPRAQQIALRSEKGFVLLRGKSTGLFAELWANGSGYASFPEYRRLQPLKEAQCTRDGCTVNKQGHILRFSHTVADLKKGCPAADAWISGYRFYPSERRGCASGVLLIDRPVFDDEGSHWAYFTDKGLEWYTTRREQGRRPWSVSR